MLDIFVQVADFSYTDTTYVGKLGTYADTVVLRANAAAARCQGQAVHFLGRISWIYTGLMLT